MPEDVTNRRCCHKCNITVTGKRKLSKCAQCHSITYCGQECQREDWPRHSKFCIPVMVTEIPDKGKGLVASKDIKKGQVIFKETAAIAVHAPSDIVPLKEMKEQISKMSVEQKSKFYQLPRDGTFNPLQLAAASRENCLQELDIFVSNSMVQNAHKDSLLLVITPTLINHSCAPNACVRKQDNGPGYGVKVIAIKDISKGEEVTECYTRGLLTKTQMRAELQTIFNFDCKCSVCSGFIPDQDGIIPAMIRLVPLIYAKYCAAWRYGHDIPTHNPFYQKKEKDWKDDAANLETAADLSKQLYIGSIQNRLDILNHFVSASQMARDPIRLKKATDMLKDEIGDTLLDNFDEYYTSRVKQLGFWSGEFQSKRNPSMEEIDYFFFMKM